MIPNGRIVISDDILLDPKNKSRALTEAYEMGGIKLLDSSKGLLIKEYQIKTDGKTILLKTEDETTWTEVMSDVAISEVDITFEF